MTPAEQADTLIDLIRSDVSSLDAIGRRIVANRIIAALADWLPTEKKSTTAEVLDPMSDEEAAAFERDRSTFGKFIGAPYGTVDFSYLAWLADEQRKSYRQITRYLSNPRVKREWQEE